MPPTHLHTPTLRPSRRWIAVACTLALILSVAWWKILPDPLFRTPYSTVLLDRDSNILGITVADDGQYRVPDQGRLSPKYITALLAFEDKRFPRHPGIDPLALLRALRLNLVHDDIISGGSTLTMQVIRLARDNPPRTIGEKIKEIILALRLEQSRTKDEILRLYAAHAPFGGNIVGVEAAALKYFGRSPDDLSWAEAALLAVLPNAPSLLYPGRNNDALRHKRDHLLRRLAHDGHIDTATLRLALAEPLPTRPRSTPCIAPHLLGRAYLQRRGQAVPTHIDPRLQERVNDIVRRHIDILRHNHIHNAAVLVAHLPTGQVRAYVGNAPTTPGGDGERVDIITAPRSSGSILKPALYALAQQAGTILPATLLPDVPTRFGNYAPANFNRDFQGVVPADQALAQSLNIPFVHLLRQYGVPRFHHDLQRLGITTLPHPPDHYGLSLILGGAECTLWDLCNLYAGIATTLLHYNQNDGTYYNHEYRRLRPWADTPVDSLAIPSPLISAGAAWLTLKALQQVERPQLESGWKHFASSINLSWKTGTSFGFRDAWAIGLNAEYVIGVWVGNADGEGRPGLLGARAAAPILFEVASLLRTTARFHLPIDDLRPLPLCHHSGYRASAICPHVDTVLVSPAGTRTPLCPYHRLLRLDSTGRYQVDPNHYPVHATHLVPWFILTPVQEWYYARTHADYRPQPPYHPDNSPLQPDLMEMIYPTPGTRVFIPRDLDGTVKGIILELAHRRPGTLVYWHVDGQYLGTTRHNHQMEINLPPGTHVLHLVDEEGNTLRQTFRVVTADTPPAD